jgi:hypothetical protein
MRESEVRERAFAMPLTSPAYPIGRIVSIIANFLSSPIVATLRSCGSSCRNHSRSKSRWSSSSLSACRTRPGSATTRKAARLFACPSRAARGEPCRRGADGDDQSGSR